MNKKLEDKESEVLTDIGLGILMLVSLIIFLPVFVGILVYYLLVVFCGVSSEWYYPIIITISCSVWLLGYIVYLFD